MIHVFRPTRLRLRTQLLLATIAILSAMTAASLLVVRQSVKREVRRQTAEALAASVRAFQRVEQQQGTELVRTASMLAELPTLKALMTTEDAATIQDASAEFWRLSGSDLLLLANASSRVKAVHAAGPGLALVSAQRLLASRDRLENAAWWLDSGNLYRVVARSIVAGAGSERHVLGVLIVGAYIDTAMAQQIGRFSATEIALTSGQTIVASTFPPADRTQLARWLSSDAAAVNNQPQELAIDGRHFEIAAIDLETGPSAPLRCYILLPLDMTYAFLSRLNRTILILGLAAGILGAGLVTLISGAITRPLDKLVTAVRALGAGDHTYSIEPHGSMEVATLAHSFTSMRSALSESQRREIEGERLAALGRAAGSISHDLRHHLAAVVANAEFLHDADEFGFDREEIYREIQRASAQMTGLIDSLLEIGNERKALSFDESDIGEVVGRAADAVRSLPEFRSRNIEVRADTPTRGRFDARRLERAFFNLILNACEAAPNGGVGVHISGNDGTLECRVWDTGGGIPELIRNSLFEPFVSAGKNNGTGLGLAIAAKIVGDHDGEIRVEQTSASGTTILVRIPRGEVRSQTHTADVSAT